MPTIKDLTGSCWLNGDFVDAKTANLHVMHHGLHYASSVFEGIRCYNNNIFLLHEHNARLHRSAEILDFEISQTAEELNAITQELLRKNNLTDCYIRPVSWRGGENLSISANGCSTQIAIFAYPWERYPEEKAIGTGLRLQTAEYKRPDPQTSPTEAKAAGNYMIASISKQKAERAGFDDCLMHDYRGYIAESSTTNFFMVKDGEIHTPTPDCFLNGLTRQTVIKMAREMGYKVTERHILPEELKTADELFLTGTALEIVGIGGIDDKEYKIGETTKRIRKNYLELVQDGGEFRLSA